MESNVFEFIRFATNLKEIHILNCKLNFTQKFISDIVEELKSARTPIATSPLLLFILKHDSIDFEEIQKLDIKNYSNVIENNHYYNSTYYD